MTREHNWADNYTFRAARIHRPSSVEEVRRVVARSSRIRAIGARHSFNDIADSPGDLIDLEAIDPDFVIDRERQTVTVGAAVNYGALASYLHAAGWALHNMASLPHVSVAGATATGTHGSGDQLGNLSTAVAALEIVTATGDLVTVNRGLSSNRSMRVSSRRSISVDNPNPPMIGAASVPNWTSVTNPHSTFLFAILCGSWPSSTKLEQAVTTAQPTIPHGVHRFEYDETEK